MFVKVPTVIFSGSKMSWGYCVAPPGLPVLGPNDGDLECERNAALHQFFGDFYQFLSRTFL